MTFIEHIEKAREAYDEKKYDEALKLYQQALPKAKNNKDTAVAWAEICWTYYFKKDFDKAIEAAENVLTYDLDYPAREDLYRTMGFSYLMLDEVAKAQEYMLKSIEIDRVSDKQKYVLYELGVISFKQQDYERAAGFFDEVEDWLREKRPEYYVSSLFFKGFIQYYRGNYDEAEAVFNQMLAQSESDLDRANAVYGRAYVSFSKKDYLKTINLCEQITRLNEAFFDMESVGFLTASSFYYLGRYDVFSQYHHELKKAFPNGRYKNELSKLAENIPQNDGGKKAN